jgi:hypothetical protein
MNDESITPAMVATVGVQLLQGVNSALVAAKIHIPFAFGVGTRHSWRGQLSLDDGTTVIPRSTGDGSSGSTRTRAHLVA